jgi:uncharacterized protein (DUF488 family)
MQGVPESDAAGAGGREVWTIGYEGRTFEDLVETLRALGVRRVVDVRDRPISLAPGFSLGPLKRNLESAGFAYREIPDLGCSAESRRQFRETGDLERFVSDYRQKLEREPRAYALLRRLVEQESSAVLCLERDPLRCHRRVLAERLESEGFRVHHLL